MASWAIHFRIADAFLPRFSEDEKDSFVIGNIAPDCGRPAEGGYDPPTEVTHRAHAGNKTDCDWQYFFRCGVSAEKDRQKRAFFLGYCVHLITDCLFGTEICDAIEKKHGTFQANPQLVGLVKREWYNLDFAYFRNHHSPSFDRFCAAADFDRDYPSFYQNGEIAAQMHYIRAFYKSHAPEELHYIYTTPEQIEAFVRRAPQIIGELLLREGYAI